MICAIAVAVSSAVSTAAAPEPAAASAASTAIATFAGGCFWCVESDFDKVPGVLSTTSGYTGGIQENPSYHEVSAGRSGHAEAVQIRFDPTKVSYAQLLEVFWHSIDPFAVNYQFCDHGSQYRSAIFVHGERQRALAEASKQALATSGRFQQPIATQIVDASKFYPAEDYHQDYYQKNPVRYEYYRYRCGRDARVEEIWGASNH